MKTPLFQGRALVSVELLSQTVNPVPTAGRLLSIVSQGSVAGTLVIYDDAIEWSPWRLGTLLGVPAVRLSAEEIETVPVTRGKGDISSRLEVTFRGTKRLFFFARRRRALEAAVDTFQHD